MKLGKVIEKESKKYSAEHGTAPTLAFLAGRFNTTEETIETSLQNMQMAKEMLITSNQKLALHIAKFYMYRGVPFGTLMQEASNGTWRNDVSFAMHFVAPMSTPFRTGYQVVATP